MAARYFIPTSGEYAWTGSVWAATQTGAAGSAATPVDGDDVYILNGTARITSGLNQSAIDLASFTVGFSGEIGTSSASLQLGATTVTHIIGGGSTLRLNILSGNMNVYSEFMGTINITGGSPALFCGEHGSINISSISTTDIVTCGCAINIGSGCTIGTLYCAAGNHRSASTVAYLWIAGRTTVTLTGATTAISSYTYILGGGVLIYDAAGTINLLNITTGCKAVATGAYGGFTVSTSAQWAGSSLFANPSVPITYTNATTKYGFR